MIDFIHFLQDNFWAVVAMISPIAILITGLINNLLHANDVWKRVISWLVAALLTTVAYYLQLIPLNEPIYVNLPITGLIIGLVSNGVYSIDAIKAFIKKLYSFINKPCV